MMQDYQSTNNLMTTRMLIEKSLKIVRSFKVKAQNSIPTYDGRSKGEKLDTRIDTLETCFTLYKYTTRNSDDLTSLLHG